MKIVVTGDRGFIGTHVVRKLLDNGHEVFGIDCLDGQVGHGPRPMRTDKYDYIVDQSYGGYSLNPFNETDAVIHLGARVGVGQSMYEPARYTHQNSYDTAGLIERLTEKNPKRLVVASSMSIYGEGPRWYDYTSGTPETHNERFELGLPVPCHEDIPPDLRSIYALTKYDQEQLCLIWGKAYDVPTVALRFFNTYGPGQSLNNPYTGVMAIFASRLLNNKPPVIYEDGKQSRDFIHVDDVANAVVHAATFDIPSGAYNVGTGVATSVLNVAKTMSYHLGVDIKPQVTGEYRKGDIRHCFADNSKIRATGWEPRISFNDGIADYCEWLKTQPIPADKFEQAHQELITHGLTK